MVWLALNDYRNAQPINGKVADFSDALIVNKAKFIASDKSDGLGGVYTFDIAAQQLPGTKDMVINNFPEFSRLHL